MPRPTSYWTLALVCALVASACQCNPRKPPHEPPRPEGMECDEDSQCETGLCESVSGDVPRCVRKCTTGCHALEVCSQLSYQRFGCVPQRAGLCHECEKDSDCPYAADRCLKSAEGNFCGRDCSFDDECPSSYVCGDAETLVEGELAFRQCIPQSGSCSCTDATAGQTVPCENESDAGRCVGVKRCEPPNGYAQCSAPAAVAEVCNNQDDDCDGRIDEDLGDLHCGIGECARVASACANGDAQACVPGTAQTERCDEKDNDCDGFVDDGFDFQNDVGNCGGCGNACVVTNAVPKCALGACAVDHCLPGFSDRDGVAANGCEYACTSSGPEICDGVDNDCNGIVDDGFNLVSNPASCGTCGFQCSAGAGTVATYQCTARVCGIASCTAGFADCNQLYVDGCEVDTQNTVQHCGGCGQACAPANAVAACAGGQCGISACAPGFANCNNQVGDGCELSTTADVMNCGACGRVCAAPHADASCVAGACRYLCQPGQVSLDGGPGCDYTCQPTNGGVERCDGLDNDCDGPIDEGVDTSADLSNCGACGNVCNLPFAVPVCSGSGCHVASCLTGHHNIDGVDSNGCEYTCLATNGGVEQCDGLDNDCDGQVDEGFALASDLNNCGSCGHACTAPSVTSASCSAGTCGVVSCVPGRANCDGQFPNGCEIDTQNNAANCGSCGFACALPFANPVCGGAVCRASSCQGGHWNLDGIDSNGCEYACSPTNGGAEICDGLDNDCDGAVDEGFNLASDPNNCGVCGHVCAAANVASSQCVTGSCGVVMCSPGYANCDGAYSNGCEVDTRSTTNHCGACGNVCVTPNGTPACVSSACAVSSCSGAYRNCNGVASDGCEVNSASDPNNCGACGTGCNLPHASSVCGTSVCRVQVCASGWQNLDGIDSNGCEYSCTPSNGGVEICDGLDNDCDGTPDEGFSLATDPNNCGSCGHACSAANVTAYQCSVGTCGVLACTGTFANCNGLFSDGCEIDKSSSIPNCGGCGLVCAPANATPQCVSSGCGIASCNGAYRNCNNLVGDGCEVNSANDVNNCGGCGTQCTAAHANNTCNTGMCGFTCQGGFYDLDGSAANGCEYACTFTSPIDVPDLGFGDANCDGVDGYAAAAIFVDGASGNDGWPGTRAQPRRTLAAGIAAAAPYGYGVYVSQGTYAEPVTMVNGVSLYGGYAASAGWSRSASNLTVISSTTTVGVTMSGVGSALELQLFTVRSTSATGVDSNGDGLSSIGVLVLNSGSLTVSGSRIEPGAGSTGNGIGASSDGPGGSPGNNATGAGPGVVGTGGASVCGANGGSGGNAGRSTTASTQGGLGGTAAGGASGAAGGLGGTYPGGGNAGRPGNPGNPGGTGAGGVNGAAGGSFGAFTSGLLYTPAAGAVGAAGQIGGGGGGGGGGSGAKEGQFNVHDLWGGHGGGGGGGACGGAAGIGGRGGGGSFGLVSINAGLTVLSSVVAAGNGGNGGSGGAGGRGGPGGQPGGTGAPPQCQSGVCGGTGGRGGVGGNGGNAGGGGGGGGGPSVCIVHNGAAPSTSGFTCVPGSGGGGGLGGLGDTAAAPTGSTGASTDVVAVP